MSTAAQRIVQLSGLGTGTAGEHLVAISQSGVTAGERLLSYSSLSSGTAAQHLLDNGAVTGVSGSLAATESQDLFGANGAVLASGAIAATEQSDAFAGTGKLAIVGVCSASEIGLDLFAAAASSIASAALAASEIGDDGLLASGIVGVAGVVAVVETPDTLLADGAVEWGTFSGELHATEVGHDLVEAFAQVVVTGPLAGHESPDLIQIVGQNLVTGQGDLAEGAQGDFSALFGQVRVQGEVESAEIGSDQSGVEGNVLVAAELAGIESGQDAGQAIGTVLVTGVIGASEAADTLFAVGRVDVRGQLAGEESTDVSTVVGGVLVQGPFASQEIGQDGLSGFVQAIVSGTSSSVEESAEDTLAGQATFGVNLTLTVEQALLLQNIYSLHGLLAPLEVSTNHRKAGEIYQEVSTSGQTTTITTVTAGSDTLHQSIGVMIEELAALHGVTAPLKVDFTSRSAGQLVQTLSKFGGVTTVTRQ